VKTASKKKKTAIVKVGPAPASPWLLNSEEITLIKNNIAKGATDEELKFLLTVARRYRLDPFKQQIWFVKRWDKSADNGKGGTGAYVWTPQVGINGLLFAAGRDHKKDLGSISRPQFGPMQKIDGGGKAPEWASVRVYKKGATEPTEAEAWWDEYAPADLSKAPFWKKMPRRMLAKCATALAIREAYPDLGGLYIPEEMERMGEDFSPSGRQIVEPEPVKVLTDADIQEHDKVISQIQIVPWKEGRVALSGPGLSIAKGEITPELWAELDVKFNTREKVTHMPVSKVFEFIDRAKKCNVEATMNEPIAEKKQPQQGSLLVEG
jgi:RecT family